MIFDDKQNLASVIDNTLLKTDATIEEILTFVDKSLPYKFASLCVSPFAVKAVKQHIGDNPTKITTVVGFPNGTHSTEVKEFEAKQALQDGADEIDVVLNVAMIHERNDSYLSNEISKLKQVCGDHVLKCIIETCKLNEDEIVYVSKLIAKNGGDFVKTSTGFGGDGAKAKDIELIAQNIGDSKLQIKASGGIRSLDDAFAMIKSGASRIGTSNGCKIVDDYNKM